MHKFERIAFFRVAEAMFGRDDPCSLLEELRKRFGSDCCKESYEAWIEAESALVEALHRLKKALIAMLEEVSGVALFSQVSPADAGEDEDEDGLWNRIKRYYKTVKKVVRVLDVIEALWELIDAVTDAVDAAESLIRAGRVYRECERGSDD